MESHIEILKQSTLEDLSLNIESISSYKLSAAKKHVIIMVLKSAYALIMKRDSIEEIVAISQEIKDFIEDRITSVETPMKEKQYKYLDVFIECQCDDPEIDSDTNKCLKCGENENLVHRSNKMFEVIKAAGMSPKSKRKSKYSDISSVLSTAPTSSGIKIEEEQSKYSDIFAVLPTAPTSSGIKIEGEKHEYSDDDYAETCIYKNPDKNTDTDKCQICGRDVFSDE